MTDTVLASLPTRTERWTALACALATVWTNRGAFTQVFPDDMNHAANVGWTTGFSTTLFWLALSQSARAAILKYARIARKSSLLVAYDLNRHPNLWDVRGGEYAARATFLELVPFVDALPPSFLEDLAF